MSVLLMGFKDYDDFDLEFHVTGVDLLRIAEVLNVRDCRTNAVAIVTIYPRGLDNDDQARYPIGYTDGDGTIDQADIFDGGNET